jgi:hypothetical protein
VREVDRKEQNGKVKAGWVKEVEKWGVERDSARNERRKPGWNKPKMPSMKKALPKPKVSDFVGESDEEDDDDKDEGEGNGARGEISDCG